MANPENQRATRLNVRLSQGMMDEVSQVAERMGLAPATVGAIAIAEYVNAKKSQRELMQMTAERTAAHSAGVIERVFSDPAALARMASAVEEAEPRLPGV